MILSARIIPGHERTITRLVNHLLRLGAEVLWEPIAFVHVSGHAAQEELKLLQNLIRPTFFIPVHGEYRHLLPTRGWRERSGPARARLRHRGRPGHRVHQDAARMLPGIPVGRVLVDGKGIGDVGAVVLRDRELLAQDGMVVVAVTVDRGTGEIIAGPEIASRGWVYERESETVLEEARTVLREALASGPARRLWRGRSSSRSSAGPSGASSTSATIGSRSCCPSSSRRRAIGHGEGAREGGLEADAALGA